VFGPQPTEVIAPSVPHHQAAAAEIKIIRRDRLDGLLHEYAQVA
jgi:hypothetical protein